MSYLKWDYIKEKEVEISKLWPQLFGLYIES